MTRRKENNPPDTDSEPRNYRPRWYMDAVRAMMPLKLPDTLGQLIPEQEKPVIRFSGPLSSETYPDGVKVFRGPDEDGAELTTVMLPRVPNARLSLTYIFGHGTEQPPTHASFTAFERERQIYVSEPIELLPPAPRPVEVDAAAKRARTFRTSDSSHYLALQSDTSTSSGG